MTCTQASFKPVTIFFPPNQPSIYPARTTRMASTPLPRYPLGKNGPQVPAIGFGLMGMFYPIYGAVPSKDKQFALL